MKKKKKIAIFHCGFIYSGGGERLVLEEAKGLLKRGYEVSIFAPTLDKNLCFPYEIEKLKVKTFLPQLPEFFPARHALWMVTSSILAPFFALRFTDIDLFIGANQPGAWIAFCVSRILGKPYLVYMNQPNRILYHRKIDEDVKWQNLREYYLIDNLIRRLRLFVAWADRVSFTNGKAIFVNGDYIGKIIAKIYKKPVVSCPAGAYAHSLKSLRLNPNTAYEGDFVIKNKNGQAFIIKRPFILLTNRHIPQKKFEYAIEVLGKFRIQNSEFRNVQLVIPSSFTPYTKDLIKLTERLKLRENVIFTGQIYEKTLQDLYKNAAIYVYTAPQEDFGMGAIEAMGWGVPVVAWNHAGPTVTVKIGKTGYLAKPYDISDFAQKIASILQSSKKRSFLGKNAWQHVKDNFSWEKHIDTMEKEIKKII